MIENTGAAKNEENGEIKGNRRAPDCKGRVSAPMSIFPFTQSGSANSICDIFQTGDKPFDPETGYERLTKSQYSGLNSELLGPYN